MSGADDYHEKHPDTNEWMLTDEEVRRARSSALEKLSATFGPGKRPASKTAMSGLVQRLARSLDVSSEELAQRIPDDTIRRTKYPVNEKKLPDGSIIFEADPGIIEGPRALVHR